MLLHDLIATGARDHPDRPALIVDDDILTFSQLDDRVSALAHAVAAVAGRGDRVAFVGANGPEWVEAYYGVPRAGAQLAFVNHRLGMGPKREAIARYEPAVLVGDVDQLAELATVGPVADLAPVVVAIGDGAVDGAVPYEHVLADGRDGAPELPDDLRPGATAWLIATSGTSGTPKVVELSHANLLAAVDATRGARPMHDDDVYLFPFPLCHVAGYNVVLFHRVGRPVVIARQFTAVGLVEQVRRHRVTNVSLAPTMVDALVDHIDATGASLAPLRTVSYGSSPISPSLLTRAIGSFGAGFQQGFGMTELSGNAVFLGAEEHERGLADEPELLAAAGRPGPTVEVRIIDDDGGDLPVGAVGEIAVRAPQVTKGYWRSPEANAASFVDGWFRTGDVGRIDATGLLSIVDRKKDIIISGGENVSSREVEDRLAEHPAIAAVAVVGAPDERWGELVCAYVVPRPGTDLTADEVLAFGRRTIGGFQQPRRVELVDDLPRNGSGKVLKHELRARLAGAPT
ncbi:MAG: AMP-binding protein [Actinobacteria bacterium]|nr:AMP-binding protein [Actinomycetota bacterium]